MGHQMRVTLLVVHLVCFGWFFSVSFSSPGDADSTYRTCVDLCEKTGCIDGTCFQDCRLSSNVVAADEPWYMKNTHYLKLKEWNCRSQCRHHCMVERENQRSILGLDPVKYHGKWPFKRVLGLQEPASVALSAFNLFVHFHGWMSFMILVYYKLPSKPKSNKAYYEFCGLWVIYGMLAINSWFWSSVFHSRDVDLTEKLDYSSAVALLGYSLIIATLRAFNIKDEATRVMVSAPLLAFITTHILYLNFYQLDYGLNMKVCVIMGIAQLLLWAVWAGLTHHPARLKLWFVVIAGGLAMLLEIYDFPPYEGYVDAHALWHASTIPLTYLWWSFIKDDAEMCTSELINKEGLTGDTKKVK